MSEPDPHEIRMASANLFLDIQDAMDDDLMRTLFFPLAQSTAELAEELKERGVSRTVIAHCLTGMVLGSVFHEDGPWARTDDE